MADDARSWFVEAMRWMRGHAERYMDADVYLTHKKEMLAACEAFADAECNAKFTWAGNTQVRHDSLPEHAACRAAIIKEVMGE